MKKTFDSYMESKKYLESPGDAYASAFKSDSKYKSRNIANIRLGAIANKDAIANKIIKLAKSYEKIIYDARFPNRKTGDIGPENVNKKNMAIEEFFDKLLVELNKIK